MSRHPFYLVLGALRLHARHEWLPHRCDACGLLVAPGRDKLHADWHYWVGMSAWAATGGRGRKPKRPPSMRPDGRHERTAEGVLIYNREADR